jgi:hypothetical protein
VQWDVLGDVGVDRRRADVIDTAAGGAAPKSLVQAEPGRRTRFGEIVARNRHDPVLSRECASRKTRLSLTDSDDDDFMDITRGTVAIPLS